MHAEHEVQNKIRKALSDHGAISWRNSVGGYRTEGGGFVRFGVGGPGGSDIILLRPVVITADHIGLTIGQFGALEIKAPGWKPRNKKDKERFANQQRFLSLVRSMGGIAEIVYSVDEALEAVSNDLPHL